VSDANSRGTSGTGEVSGGEPTVIIGNMPAARVGDLIDCGGTKDAIAEGETSVIIGDKPAARLGDTTQAGGALSTGCPTVNIGSSPKVDRLKTDKPFCEECEEKAQRRAQRQRRRR
jgi:uncharacterized Zn-binding protein involved in type VI secretion